jgi:hypothetical protein
MNTPRHASDADIDTLFEMLPDLGHDCFEQRRKNERPLTTEETEAPIVEGVKHGS